MNRILIALMLLVGMPLHAADIKGDVNGDGALTMDDAHALAGMVMGLTPATTAADINGDGVLSITDVTKLIDMVLNKKEGGMDIGISGWEDDGEDYGGTVGVRPQRSAPEAAASLSLASLLLTPGQTADMCVAMDNTSTINGLQLTVTLPDGFELLEASLLRTDDSYVLKTDGTTSGSIKLLAYSTANKAFSGTAGEVLKIKVKASNSVGSHSVRLTGIELSDASFKAIRPDNISAEVVVKNKYTLTVTASEGGSAEIVDDGLSVASPYVAWDGTKLSVIATPSEGYHFDSWSDGDKSNPREVTLTSNTTLTASFAPNTYTITYKVDGETYKTEMYEYGAAITPVAEPTKEGYTFSGWSDIPATMPAHDVEVVGSFGVNTYKIVYVVDGETYKTEMYEYGAAITPVAEPMKEGYTFSGWSDIPATMPAHDVEVVGSFSINTYKIVYVVDGETYKTGMYEYGAAITPIAAPTKEGYTFSGWSDIPATMPAHDVTVTGTFTVNKYMVRYYDGETLLAEYEVEYGAEIPTYEYDNEEFIFEGWEGKVYDTMPAHDIAYYAITTPNGIEAIQIDDNADITVYTLAGRVAYKGRKADLPRGLRGVFVITHGSKTIKTML